MYLRVGFGELHDSWSTVTAGASSRLVVLFRLTIA